MPPAIILFELAALSTTLRLLRMTSLVVVIFVIMLFKADNLKTSFHERISLYGAKS